uniref:Uncharacterized protein n=1 Tax=Dulem virus 39 TaxID=3145757 RepID=A0AAU8B7K5_9CAUD
MKQNPCRYCALSMERNGRHYPSYSNECGKCEYQKKHRKYLKSQRKYECGEKITNLAELLEQTWVFCGYLEKPMHIEAVKSWQVRIVLSVLEQGRFYKAVKKNMEE